VGFEFYKESYTGAIKEISLGKGKGAITVGGETCYPFYQFEGKMSRKPIIAMEIWDIVPEEWPDAVNVYFQDVFNDPVAWAQKCVKVFGAKMIVLQLKSTDPNGENRSAQEASKVVKAVASAIDVPLVVWGTANAQKDEEVLKLIAEECQGMNLILGPVEDKNHKGIGASAMGFGHTIIASSPIDVNIAKQANILLENLGMPMDRVLIDPTTGGLGYGLEYSYSVMERIRMAALVQGDDKLQLPIINNLGNEIWKSKEAKQSADEAPTLGDPEVRGIMMEAVAATVYFIAGSNVMVMRHPEAIRLANAFIDLLVNGGSAMEIKAVEKKMPTFAVDLAAIAPATDLTLDVKVSAKPVAEVASKTQAPKTEPPKAKTEKADVPKEIKPKKEEEPVVEPKVEEKATEIKINIEAEAKIKADADSSAKAKKDVEKEVEKVDKAQKDAEEALREKRAEEQEQRNATKKAKPKCRAVSMTASEEQLILADKIIRYVVWNQRRGA